MKNYQAVMEERNNIEPETDEGKIYLAEYVLEYLLDDYQKEEFLVFCKNTSLYIAIWKVEHNAKHRAENFKSSISTSPGLESLDLRFPELNHH
jgi:hypothetical protein